MAGETQDFTLDLVRRTTIGSGNVNRMRKDGFIPAVVYHRGEGSIPVTVNQKQFVQLAQRARASQVFTIKSNESALDKRTVIVRDIQRDHLANKVLHVDFQALKDDEEITLKIPLSVKGEAPGVKNDGGILSIIEHEVLLACLPKYIPQTIEVDISKLNIGESIHARNLVLSEGVRIAEDPDHTIVTVVAQRAEKVEEPAAATPDAAATATGAPAAGAAATPAAGAAPATGAKAAPAAKATQAKK